MIISKYLLRYYPKGWSGLRTRVKDLNILNVGLDQSQLFFLVGRSIRQLFRSARTSYREPMVPVARKVFLLQQMVSLWIITSSCQTYLISNHIFSKSSWSPQSTDAPRWQIHTYTNDKCLKDPSGPSSCAIFLKSMGVKDIKYDIPMWHGGHGH